MRLGDDASLEKVARDLTQVEVPLVETGLLDRRHDPAHGRPDMTRVLAVERMAGTHEHGVRAAPDRLRSAHRRMDAETARDVVGGRHDTPPLRIATDDQRLLTQLGVLELFDGGEERVEVEMGDDAGDGHANKRTGQRRRTASPPNDTSTAG